MPPAPTFEPRAVCARCRRPESVCYCAHLPTLPTRTRVVLLQHPRERYVAIGTAHMASLCLPNSELLMGVDWQEAAALDRELADPERPAALLYPGEGAVDVVRSPPGRPVTLIVVDGTWSQTKKLVRHNPKLASLPRYAFTPEAPSEYRIRREPDEAFVSTIEALAIVLGALEGDPERFQAMLRPFRAMVDGQIACERTLHGARTRHRRAKPPAPRTLLPRSLVGREADLVCVIGEANAWPYSSPQRTGEDELVHWIAVRVATGERLERVVAPQMPLAPRTCKQTGLAPEVLAGGTTPQSLLGAWEEFLRPSDVLCFWGDYATSLFEALGARLPAERLDLRHAARAYAKGRAGTPEEFSLTIGIEPPPPLGLGRAGARLAYLAAIARHGAAALAALEPRKCAV